MNWKVSSKRRNNLNICLKILELEDGLTVYSTQSPRRLRLTLRIVEKKFPESITSTHRHYQALERI